MLVQATNAIRHVGSGVLNAVRHSLIVFLPVVMKHGVELAEDLILGLLFADADLLDVRE